MNSHSISFHVILIFISGLISCSPDKISETTKAPDAEMIVEIRNNDRTLQRIKNTKRLNVSSELVLIGSEEAPLHGNFVVESRCKTNFIEEVLTYETGVKNAAHLAMKDILPALIFSPSAQEARWVACDLEIQIQQPNQPETHVILTDVEITGTDSFSNLEPDFLQTAKQGYILFSQLAPLSISWPSASGTSNTLCEGSNYKNFIHQQETSSEQAFSQELFELNNLLQCRMSFRNESDRRLWVSPAFYVQNKITELDVKLISHVDGSANIDFDESPLLSLEVTNISNVPTYFKIELPTPNLQIAPIYQQWTSLKKSQAFPLQGKWTIIESQNYVFAKVENETVFRLKPNQRLAIQLLASGHYSCKKHFSTSSHPLRCSVQQTLFHSGQLVSVSQFPKVSESLFENIDAKRWRTMTLKPPESFKNGSSYSFWGRNREVKDFCSNLSSKKPSGFIYDPMRWSSPLCH